MRKERKKNTNLACFGLRPVDVKVQKWNFKLTITKKKETNKQNRTNILELARVCRWLSY